MQLYKQCFLKKCTTLIMVNRFAPNKNNQNLVEQCCSIFLSSSKPWYTFAFVMEPHQEKFERHDLLVRKSSISLLDNSTNEQVLQNLKSKKFDDSLVLAFLEFRCYIQNLVLRKKEPVSEICVVPFSNFGNWITFGPLRIWCLFYIWTTLLITVHTFAVVIISLHTWKYAILLHLPWLNSKRLGFTLFLRYSYKGWTAALVCDSVYSLLDSGWIYFFYSVYCELYNGNIV